MHIKSVTSRRVIVSREEVSIDGNVLIQPDDPMGDAISQHIADVVRRDEMPAPLQECVDRLLSLCGERLIRVKGLKVGPPV